jgi:transposase InsO family protein
MDFIGPFTASRHHGYNYVIVVACHLSKETILIPARSNARMHSPLDAPAVARLFYNHVTCKVGMPKRIVSDRDSRFTGPFWQTLCSITGTKTKMSTAFHPQSDGLIERVNRSLLETLRVLVDSDGDTWPDHLPAIAFALNSTIHAATGFTPFWITTGRNPTLPADLSVPAHPDARSFITEYTTRIAAARDALLIAQDRLYRNLLREHSEDAPSFQVGDRVWLSTRNLKLQAPLKLKPPYLGPFTVLEVFGNTCRLNLPPHYNRPGRKLHPTFNFDLLKRFVDRPPHLGPAGSTPAPLPLLSDTPSLSIHRIEAWQDHPADGRHYLIHWNDDTYPPEWLSHERVHDEAPGLLQQFEALHQLPTPTGSAPGGG